MLHTFKKWSGGVAVIALTAGFIAIDGAPAKAAITDHLYSGGGTLAELLYRDLWDCYGSNGIAGELGGIPGACTGGTFNGSVETTYVGVGSGNGKKAFINHDSSLLVSGSRKPDNPPIASPNDVGPFYGTGTGAAWVPGTGVGPNFPQFQVAGSDDPLTSGDITTYNTHALPTGGAPIQIPTLITTVTVPFTPASGTWTPNGKTLTGASSKVQFSTNTWCGIFTGAITDWSNSEITADNGGVQLGTGPINVFVRSDGSGTTFLFSNAFLNQCGSASLPRSTHPVPDAWLTANSITNATPFVSNNNFFINLDASHANILPANFHEAAGNGSLIKAVDAQAGGVGYASPEVDQPVKTGLDSNGNPVAATANLQNVASFTKTRTQFVYVPPTPASGTAIMSTLKPPSTTAVCPGPQCFTDPLAWGATNPVPTSAKAFPIGGFTFIDLYTCYNSLNDVNSLVGTAAPVGFIKWYYGSSTINSNNPAAVLAIHGFSPVPNAWKSAINKLTLTNKPTKIGHGGDTKSTPCKTLTGI